MNIETVRIVLALAIMGLFLLGGLWTVKGFPQSSINMIGVVGFVLYCLTFLL